MPLSIATHNGPFHADDVTAVALLRVFWDADATVDRSRDPARWDQADVVVDVGGVFEPERFRFDHHQASYEGQRSSAGMVLDGLVDTGRVAPGLAKVLRDQCIDYIDDVDNGRVAPAANIPCIPKLVGAFNEAASTPEGFDAAFEDAVAVVRLYLQGVTRSEARIAEARSVVQAAMADAVASKRNVLLFDEHCAWKAPYFELDGAEHPTEFVLFPGHDDSWRIVAIPPSFGDFAQKRSLPEAWAGLTDEALEAVTGVPGSVFCHRNLFIAVFKTREGAVKALDDNGLYHRA